MKIGKQLAHQKCNIDIGWGDTYGGNHIQRLGRGQNKHKEGLEYT